VRGGRGFREPLEEGFVAGFDIGEGVRRFPGVKTEVLGGQAIVRRDKVGERNKGPVSNG